MSRKDSFEFGSSKEKKIKEKPKREKSEGKKLFGDGGSFGGGSSFGKSSSFGGSSSFGKEKKEKPKKETKSKKSAAPAENAPAKPPAPKPKTGGSVLDFWPLVRVALDLLNDLRLKLRVDHLKLHMTMAADDPCDLAIHYGRMNASLAGLITQLERFLVIKKRDVHIDCDFAADQTVILARLDLTITLGRILSIAVRYGVRALTTFLKIKKQREGGADL